MKEKVLNNKYLLSVIFTFMMIAAMLPMASLKAYAEERTNTWTYDAETDTVTVDMDIPTSVPEEIPYQVTLTGSASGINDVYVVWGRKDSTSPFTYKGEGWANAGAETRQTGVEYGYLVIPDYPTSGHSASKIIINGKTYDNVGDGGGNYQETFVVVDLGEADESGDISGGDFSTYTLTFDANGHGSAPAAQTEITNGDKATKPSDPTASGYSFAGWYKEADCINAWDFDNDTVTEDTTLYAKWVENAVPASSMSNVTATKTPTTTYKNTTTLNKGVKFTVSNKKVIVKYGKVSGADHYVIYGSYCGKSLKKLKTTKSTSVAITKLNGKSLKANRNYRFQIVAMKGNKVVAKSLQWHVAGAKSKRYTNTKQITVKKSTVVLSTGKTAKISATRIKANNKKKLLGKEHGALLRYRSANKYVATVSANGTIKGVSKGTTYVYVYAANGAAKAVKVTVK